MSDCSSAEISVVLVTPDRYDTIRKTLSHLREQTVRDRLEIVIVAPLAKGLKLDEGCGRRFVREMQAAITSILQTLSLAAILVFIEPLILLVLAPSALPYLFFQWRLLKQYSS